MTDEWEEILDDYNHAKTALWGSPEEKNWHRDKETGYYFMWSAYYKAMKAEPKDYLLLARILAMVADQAFVFMCEWDRYTRYVKPAMDAYELAIQAGQKPTEKELQEIRSFAEYLLYERKCWNAPYEEQVKWIKGHEQLEDVAWQFPDSIPVLFEHTKKTARLKLDYEGVVVTFLFEGASSVQVQNELLPRPEWISEFSCYPCQGCKDLLVFDVVYYKITCSAISIESIEFDDDYEDDYNEDDE